METVQRLARQCRPVDSEESPPLARITHRFRHVDALTGTHRHYPVITLRERRETVQDAATSQPPAPRPATLLDRLRRRRLHNHDPDPSDPERRPERLRHIVDCIDHRVDYVHDHPVDGCRKGPHDARPNVAQDAHRAAEQRLERVEHAAENLTDTVGHLLDVTRQDARPERKNPVKGLHQSTEDAHHRRDEAPEDPENVVSPDVPHLPDEVGAHLERQPDRLHRVVDSRPDRPENLLGLRGQLGPPLSDRRPDLLQDRTHRVDEALERLADPLQLAGHVALGERLHDALETLTHIEQEVDDRRVLVDAEGLGKLFGEVALDENVPDTLDPGAHLLEAWQHLVVDEAHQIGQDREESVADLDLKVVPRRPGTLLLPSRRVRLASERTLSVRSLLEQHLEPRLSFRRLQRSTRQLRLTAGRELSLDRCLIDGHAVLLDRVRLATHQRRNRRHGILRRAAILCSQVRTQPDQLLRLGRKLLDALVLESGAQHRRHLRIGGRRHADRLIGSLRRLKHALRGTLEHRLHATDSLLSIRRGFERILRATGQRRPDTERTQQAGARHHAALEARRHARLQLAGDRLPGIITSLLSLPLEPRERILPGERTPQLRRQARRGTRRPILGGLELDARLGKLLGLTLSRRRRTRRLAASLDNPILSSEDRGRLRLARLAHLGKLLLSLL